MKKPVLIELDAEGDAPTPAEAPPIPEDAPTGAAMQKVAALATRERSPLARWFWGLLFAVLAFFISLTAWNAVTVLLAANPLLGLAASILLAAFLFVVLLIAAKELAAFSRLGRIDRIKASAEEALTTHDLKAARKSTAALAGLYGGRPDTEWGRGRLAERKDEVLDADGLLALAETELLAPLDAAAIKEVEAAARQVATVTALVPLALADVVAALGSNLRMIRRIAEIYGGRSGTLGS
ncbi:MAG: TIGR01620 family protein, partial [Pseudomonadota bacterium]